MTKTNTSNYLDQYNAEKQHLASLQTQLLFLKHEKNAGLPSIDSKIEELKRKLLEKNKLIDSFCSEPNRARTIQINAEVEDLLNVVATEIKQLQEHNLRVATEKAKQDISNLGYILSLESSLESKSLKLESINLTQAPSQQQIEMLKAKVETLKTQNLKYRKKYLDLEEELKQTQDALSKNKRRQKTIFVYALFSVVALFGLAKTSRK